MVRRAFTQYGQRKTAVANTTALAALTGNDEGTIRRVTADGLDYQYDVEAVSPDVVSDDGVGGWWQLTGASPDTVPESRTITAGTALTGGGDLSANRTLNVDLGTGASQAAAGDHDHDADYLAQDGWTLIASANYTATPASTSQLTMSDTTGLAVGLPIKYTISGTDYYGVVDSVTEDTNVTIVGAPMGDDLSALYVGTPAKLSVVNLFVASTYADGTDTDLLANDMSAPLKWLGPAAHLVFFSANQATADSGTEPKVNIQIGNAAVSTNDSNNGVQLSTAGTWVDNSDVAINTTNYAVAWGDELEVACTAAGGTGDAADLTLLLLFVSE